MLYGHGEDNGGDRPDSRRQSIPRCACLALRHWIRNLEILGVSLRFRIHAKLFCRDRRRQKTDRNARLVAASGVYEPPTLDAAIVGTRFRSNGREGQAHLRRFPELPCGPPTVFAFALSSAAAGNAACRSRASTIGPAGSRSSATQADTHHRRFHLGRYDQSVPACLVHPLSPRKPSRGCRPIDCAMR